MLSFFQAVLIEHDTMAISGKFKDGIPAPGEVFISKIVNVSAKDFPIQLEFENLPFENFGDLLSPSCPNFHSPVAINSPAVDHQVVSWSYALLHCELLKFWQNQTNIG